MVTMQNPLTLSTPLIRRATGLALAAAAALALSGCVVVTPGAGAGAGGGSGPGGGPDPIGSWGTVDSTGVPFLTFAEGGQFNGSDGCNTLSGMWELDGNTIDFENVATTLMACEGVDTWLSALDEATISGTTMTILNEADKVIGTLERAN